MTTTAQFTALIRDIVAAYVQHPDELRIEAQSSEDGNCYFALRCARADEKLIVGGGASHVNALMLLVQAFGWAEGRGFTLRAHTPGPRTEAPRLPAPDAADHDPRPARELLGRILEGLDVSAFRVEMGPTAGAAGTFVFNVLVKDALDYRTLTSPARRGGDPEQTLLAALGTLFRAMGRKGGVRYDVAVVEP